MTDGSDAGRAADIADKPGTDVADRPEADAAGHLSDLPDGSGCTEIWEHLSGARVGEGEPEN